VGGGYTDPREEGPGEGEEFIDREGSMEGSIDQERGFIDRKEGFTGREGSWEGREDRFIG
jgi:hypothetical protein